MENNNSFKFEILNYHTYTREGVEKVVISATCNFGFIIKLYTTSKRLVEIQDEIKKNNPSNLKDISKYVNVYADEHGNFSYYIKSR